MMEQKQLPVRNAVWQIVASFIAHSSVIQVGISMAFSTILLPQIMVAKKDLFNNTTVESEQSHELRSELIVDKEEASWIASLVTIATPVGSLLTGPLMDRFGRKVICLVSTVPFIISWILVIITTDNVYSIYVARLLAGFGGGLTTVAIVYTSEITHPSIRPMLLSFTSVFVSFGILLTLLLNYFLTWKIVAACCEALIVLSLVCTLFIPESPSWIVGFRGTDANECLMRAERNLKWLYKHPKDYENEYNDLVKIKEQKTAAKKDALVVNDQPEVEVTLRSPQVWKPLVIVFILMSLQQFSGCYILIFYAVQIFQESGSMEVDQFLSVVILGVVRFAMAVVSMFLSKKCGRRPLLISSAVGMAASVMLAALWVHFSSRGLLPVLCLLLYVLFASYGVMVIPWTLIGELLPLRIRGKGSGFMVAVAYVHMFVTTKLFIAVLDHIGIFLVFVFFSVFSLLFSIFVYFKIPETLGKSFQEIESSFK